MEAGHVQNSVNDPKLGEMLDGILDAVLALKARLGNSNRDSNSLGGTNDSEISAGSCMGSKARLPLFHSPRCGFGHARRERPRCSLLTVFLN
jgi:hypothetical protein